MYSVLAVAQVFICAVLVLPTAVVPVNFGAADRLTFGAGTSDGPVTQPPTPPEAEGPPLGWTASE